MLKHGCSSSQPVTDATPLQSVDQMICSNTIITVRAENRNLTTNADNVVREKPTFVFASKILIHFLSF